MERSVVGKVGENGNSGMVPEFKDKFLKFLEKNGQETQFVEIHGDSNIIRKTEDGYRLIGLDDDCEA